MTVRILITDDHGVVRQGLRMFLSLDPQLEVVGEAENGEEALAMARELKPDVVLMDLLMPVMDGIAATEAIRRELPEVEVLALTSVLEDVSVSGRYGRGPSVTCSRTPTPTHLGGRSRRPPPVKCSWRPRRQLASCTRCTRRRVPRLSPTARPRS